ncbi:MAG: hypothetical protein PUB40_02515 [Lachnospiraceae bacterium]|nr:hypothetical protein [Lachnospiraceae bacterium]
MISKKKIAAALLAGCLAATTLTSCGTIDNMAVVKINGGKDKITYGYANFNARLTQAMYDVVYSSSGQSTDDMWTKTGTSGTKTMEDSTKDQVMESMKAAYYLRKNAKDYKIKLTDKEKKNIEKAAKAFMKNNSKAAKKQLGATQEYVEEYLTDQVYTKKMQDAIKAAADTTVTDEEANMKSIEYVFYNTQMSYGSDGSMVLPTEDDIKTYKANADKLAASKDFDATVTEVGATASSYNYDIKTYKEAKKNGYFTDSTAKTQVDFSVLDAVDKLSDGETTAVIEVKDKGYYVAHMKSTSDSDLTESNRTTLQDEKKTDFYNDTLKKYEAKSTWTLNKYLWSKVRFIDRFEGNLATTTDTDTN